MANPENSVPHSNSSAPSCDRCRRSERLPQLPDFILRRVGPNAIGRMHSIVDPFAMALQYRLLEIGLNDAESGLRRRLEEHQEVFSRFVSQLLKSDEPERDAQVSDVELLQRAVSATVTGVAGGRKNAASPRMVSAAHTTNEHGTRIDSRKW